MSRRGVLVAVTLAIAACSSSGEQATPTTEAVTAATGTDSSTAAPETVGASSPPVTAAEQPASTTVPPPVFEPQPIEWEQYNDAVDVGTLEVPVDYEHPEGPYFQLRLARYNALDQEHKIGTLLVNPGGPGWGGSDLAITAADRYDRPLRERFDIIGWDPRGTGQSLPAIDCIDNYDEFFAGDSTPDDDSERTAAIETAERFVEACETRNGDILQHVGTNDSARDIDVIRRALGEETISYFGFSYGSELGSVWATMFPETVRAMVLDGAVDPDAEVLESRLAQWRGFESSLNAFLADCSSRQSCAFHNRGDSEAAFDALMTQLDTTPVVGAPDRPPVNRTMATVGVIQAMYSDAFWPALAESLAAAQLGDGAGLLQLFDTYYRRSVDGTWGNELEAFRVISCVDNDDRRPIEEIESELAAVSEAAPRLVPSAAATGFMCTFMPPTNEPRIPITAGGAGPVVVIGTTGDPSTPVDSTRAMADVLEDGRLVVVTANHHTGYGLNRCVIDVVNSYLIDLAAPADETTCE